MTERYRDTLTLAYGPFQPGTVARAIRDDHAALGYRTCWHCLGPFRPQRFVSSDGRLHRPGRGRWYCSRDCARADRADTLGRSIAEVHDDGLLVLDLGRGRGRA